MCFLVCKQQLEQLETILRLFKARQEIEDMMPEQPKRSVFSRPQQVGNEKC